MPACFTFPTEQPKFYLSLSGITAMRKFFLFLYLYIFSLGLEASEARLAVPGGNIWYSIRGSGSATPLIVIHGGPGGSSCSYGSLEKISTTRPIVLYDQLGAGHSDSSKDSSLWQISHYVEELDLLITTLHRPKVHLLGHSWGAAIAAQYLLEHGSQKIASIIYAGPYLNSQDWIAGTRELRKQLDAQTQATLAKHEMAGTTDSAEYQKASEAFYAKFLFHRPHTNPATCDERSWNSNIYSYMWGNSEFEVQGTLKNFDATPSLATAKIPTLFLIGEFDEVPESTIKHYLKLAPSAKMVVIGDAGHMSMVDQPDAFVKEINLFLKGVDATETHKPH